jgi:hypothetical protein
MTKAQSTGERVEVVSLRSETDREFADPSGSWVRESYLEPVRVRQAGSWRDIDTTLELSGGRWAPRVSRVQASISDGGTDPFLTVTEGTVSWSLSWPDPLPRPVVSGQVAVFAEVLPSVDLVVHVDGASVGESLVVKSREAGQHAKVRKIQFRSTVVGGRVMSLPGGGFEVIDAAGAARLSTPVPVMWDSRGARLTSTAESVTVADLKPAGEHSRSVFEGDRVSGLGQAVATDLLTLTPDASVLDDPATTFPVIIDPTTSPKTTPYRWAMVNKS